jgi:hypothetical protein
MADAQATSYREQHIDDTVEDHERRITKNERRWLVTKGALMMLAAIKGVDFGVSQLAGVI